MVTVGVVGLLIGCKLIDLCSLQAVYAMQG